MTIVIDFAAAMQKRFFAWASQYVKFPPDVPIDVLLIFLVEKKIFTLDEIRKELNARKIALHECFFDEATAYLKGATDEQKRKE